jgi:hypothetical protein
LYRINLRIFWGTFVRITVTAIEDSDDVVLVRGTSAFGRRGKFGCPLVTGEVIFIAAAGAEGNLRVGNSLNVQTGWESLSNLKLIDSAIPPSMQPLAVSGDYLIRGRVIFVAPQGIVRVSVRGLIFALQRQELDGLDPQLDEMLECCLHGLSMWDQAT